MRSPRLPALAVAIAVTVAACGSDADVQTSTTATPSLGEPADASEASTTAAAAPATTSVEQPASPPESSEPESSDVAVIEPSTTAPSVEPVDQWAFDFVGAQGPADDGVVRIGFANQPSFSPESDVAARAAVDYLNTELTGLAGRRIELVTCPIETVADADACATEFAADDVALVVTGALNVGGAELYAALDGVTPVLVGNGLTTADFLTPSVFGYTVGGAGVVAGLAEFITQRLQPSPTTVGVVYLDSDAGNTVLNLFVAPTFADAGIETTLVPIRPDTDAQTLATDLTSSGAATADVVLAIADATGCADLYEALTIIEATPTVVGVGLCNSTAVTERLDTLGIDDVLPDGWYFGSNGYSLNIANLDAGIDTYLDKLPQYGDPIAPDGNADITGLAPLTFSTFLAVAKAVASTGPDVLDDTTALRTALFEFEGPMPFQAGTLDCGNISVRGIALPSLCASQMGVQQYTNGEWTPIADANNDQAIALNDN